VYCVERDALTGDLKTHRCEGDAIGPNLHAHGAEEDAHGLDLEAHRGEQQDPNADQGGWRLNDGAGGKPGGYNRRLRRGMRIRIATLNAENLLTRPSACRRLPP